MRRILTYLGIGMVLLGSSGLLHAQAFGQIVGTVTDPSGAVIPGAKVTVTQTGTNLVRSVTTNVQGEYVIPSLNPATYNLSVDKSGFRTYIHKDVTLLANQALTVNVKLQVGQTTQEVTVTGAAPLVNTTNGAVGQVVEQRRMVDLPLNGRNAATLTTLIPGVVQDTQTGANQGSTKTFPEAVPISANGSRGNSTSFTLDGADNVDEYTDVNSPFPFPDALQEFSVQTSNYSSKYGSNSGGEVNIVTKSGTNQLHGDGFEFVRNAMFNARNFFTSQRDQLKRNQFGGTIGGPVVIPGVYNGHNRTFFFFGYQGTRLRNVSGGDNSYVPTNAELNGDFSALLNANNPDNPTGQSIQIINPSTGQPYAGNQIDPATYDPAALNLLKQIPRATGTGQIFYSTPGIQEDYNQFITRGDESISSKDQLTLRYFYDRYSHAGFYSSQNLLQNRSHARIVYHNAMVQETHTFSPNLLNTFRVSYARTGSSRGPAPGTPTNGDLGINIWQPAQSSLSIHTSGFFSVSSTNVARFIRNDYNFDDDINLIKGKNNISFGGSFDRSFQDTRNTYRSEGEFYFSGDETGFAIADLLLGRVHEFRQGYGEYKENRNNFIGVYMQDQIRATRRLTLDAGFRYEPAWPWREKKGRVTLFRPNAFYAGRTSQMFVNAPPGLFFPGDPGVSPRGTTGDFNNIAPRFGFAYDVFGNGKTSIRGGAGIFYDSRQPAIINNQFVDDSPWSPQVVKFDLQGSLSNPLVGIVNYPFPFTWPPQKDFLFPSPTYVVSYDPGTGLIIPITYSYNLQIENQLPGNWLVRVGYVGSRANHLRESTNINPAVYIPNSTLGTDARRIIPGYSEIELNGQDINSGYNSLQASVEKRFTSGPTLLDRLTLLTSYTYSKSMDDVPVGGDNVDLGADSISALPYTSPYRHQFDYGPSYFDHTQRLSVSYVLGLPRLSNQNTFIKHVLGDWEMTGILTAQSGNPFTVQAGKDQSQTGIGQDRGVLLGPAKGPGACGNSAPCVNFLSPSSFALPAIGTFGNTGKDSIYGPSLFTWDMGFFKDIPLMGSERYRLQFRAEFFNIFNHVNYDNPNNTVSSGGFGTIEGAGDPRIGQLALKIFF